MRGFRFDIEGVPVRQCRTRTPKTKSSQPGGGGSANVGKCNDLFLTLLPFYNAHIVLCTTFSITHLPMNSLFIIGIYLVRDLQS